jgi:hypothetical protein
MSENNNLNDLENIIEDATSKLIREVELEGNHPARIILKCGDGMHVYYSRSHLPKEVISVLNYLPGNRGYTKEDLLHRVRKLVDVIEQLPDESINQLQPPYKRSKVDEKNTESMVSVWRNSKNELNVFEGTQPVGDLPYREEDLDGTRVLILEDSGYVVEKT